MPLLSLLSLIPSAFYTDRSRLSLRTLCHLLSPFPCPPSSPSPPFPSLRFVSIAFRWDNEPEDDPQL